jgi:hypothetical protein
MSTEMTRKISNKMINQDILEDQKKWSHFKMLLSLNVLILTQMFKSVNQKKINQNVSDQKIMISF